jgi:hypothetical protein
MPIPEIDAANLKKPLCYDPEREQFIFFDEIVSGKEKIVSLDELSGADLKRLVVERQRAGPDYTVQAISGPPMSRDDVVRAIEQDEPFGSITLEAETSYLRWFLSEVEQALYEATDDDIRQALSQAAETDVEPNLHEAIDSDVEQALDEGTDNVIEQDLKRSTGNDVEATRQ